MQHKKRKEPLLWKPLPLKGIISSQMSLVPKGVKSLSAFAFWTGSATGLLPVRMLQTGNKGFCLGLPGSPGRCSRSCPLRSLVGPRVGKSFRMCCLSQQCPAARPCIGLFFSFFKLWTRIPTCPLRALNSDHPESINPCVTWGKFGVLFVWKKIFN